MILPTKHLSTSKSLLGVGAVLLRYLARPVTISTLWSKTKDLPEVVTFKRFVLTLDLLYMLGAIEFHDGLLRRTGS